MKENDLIVCDFESYYDSDFTLKGKGISTSEYIRDSRFEIISCSIKVNNRVPFCYFGKEAVAKALAKIKWDKATLLAHHTHFDGLILSHHFGHVPKRYADTLSMARALHPKGHSNSLEDVAIMYNKLNKLVMPDFKGKHVNDLTKAERKAIAEYNNRDVESCYEIDRKSVV